MAKSPASRITRRPGRSNAPDLDSALPELTAKPTPVRTEVCPKCGNELIAPEWSEFFEGDVLHVWSCVNCGNRFETTASSSDAIRQVPAIRAKPSLIDALLRHGYSESEIFALVVPKRTLARRVAVNEPLTVEETDKALRLERIATQTERVFGARDKAYRWLRKPKQELSGKTPVAYLASEAGARVIEEMLYRIEHGIFA
jgi:putative toxin-antitoxin system antitoxin component (TIGR02293 family)